MKSVSGDVTINDLKGSVRIHTVSGDTDGKRIVGSLDLDTVSGDVELTNSDLIFIKGNSVSGDMRFHTRLVEGPYAFKSVSGDVRLTVPVDSRCTCELHSLSGELGSAFPINGYTRHHGLQTLNVQGGGVQVSLNSVSGNLFLDCQGEIHPVSESIGNSFTKKRRSVLEQLERGEMTVDEALGQLHA